MNAIYSIIVCEEPKVSKIGTNSVWIGGLDGMVSVYPATAREQRNMIKKWSVAKKRKPARIRCMANIKAEKQNYVWIGEVSPEITIWSTQTFEFKGSIRIDSPNVAEIVQHHTNGSVWVVCTDYIYVLDPNTRQMIKKFSSQATILTSLPVDDKMFMGTSDGKILVWNEEYEKVSTLTAHSSKIFCMCLDYRGFLWSGSFDTTIIVWDTNTLKPVEELAQHQDSIRSLGVKGEFVWSVSIDNTLRCWSNIYN